MYTLIIIKCIENYREYKVLEGCSPSMWLLFCKNKSPTDYQTIQRNTFPYTVCGLCIS